MLESVVGERNDMARAASRTWHGVQGALSILVAVCLVACSSARAGRGASRGTEPPGTGTDGSVSDGTGSVLGWSERECADFAWMPDEELGGRAGLAVPVTLGGRAYWFQLDTGLDVTVLYGDDLVRDLALGTTSRDGMRWARLAGALGGLAFEREVRVGSGTQGNSEGGPPVVGSIGLDVIVGGVVLIDFPGSRICATADSGRGRAVPRSGSTIPAILRDGKLFLEVEIGGELTSEFFFDTGASAMGLVLDRDDWARWVGKAPAAGGVRTRAVRAFSRQLTTLTAEARLGVRAGPIRLESVPLTCVVEHPSLFRSWKFPARGLIGNLPFLDYRLLLDLAPPHPRVEVLAPG